MKSPATPKGQRTRERLLEASGTVFARKGCAAAGVADIAAEAGLAVGGFYRYFASKEEVVSAVVDEFRLGLVSALEALPKGADARDEAAGIARAFFAAASWRKDFFKVMREAEAADEGLARGFYDSAASAMAARLAPHCAPGRAQAHAWALLGSLYFFAVKHVAWDGGRVPESAVAAAADLCAGGISPRPFPAVKAPKPAPAPRRPRGDTAAALEAAAEETFGRCGYAGARVAEIARRAGCAAGTFYLFFPSKRAALEKVVLGLRDALTGRALEYSKLAASRLETELLSFRALFDFIAEHPYGYRIMREAEFADPALADAYYGYILRNYAAGLKRSAAPGEFTVADPDALALALMGIGHMLGMKRVLWGGFGGMTETELLRAVFEGAVRENRRH